MIMELGLAFISYSNKHLSGTQCTSVSTRYFGSFRDEHDICPSSESLKLTALVQFSAKAVAKQLTEKQIKSSDKYNTD